MKPIYNAPIFIQFHHADPAGILYFGRFFEIAHGVYEKQASELAGGWDLWFSNEALGIPLRHVEADYYRPVLAGQNYTVKMFVHSISDSAFTLYFGFEKEGVLHAEVKTTHVFCDSKTFKKIKIPDRFRAFLEGAHRKS